MSRCRETYVIMIDPGDSSGLELACDLDEHRGVLDFHFDKLRQLEWRRPLVPVGVPLTRAKPHKAGAVSLPQPSFSSETSEFEVMT